MSIVALRPYAPADEAGTIALWHESWRATFPEIDWDARLAWWTARWRDELVGKARIVVAEIEGKLAGFVTIDPASRYLDQIVVGTDFWGQGVAEALLGAARKLSPAGIELHVNRDNARAIGFYRRQGFVVTAETANPLSGKPIYAMRWEPGC